jgi:hypothetical protein
VELQHYIKQPTLPIEKLFLLTNSDNNYHSLYSNSTIAMDDLSIYHPSNFLYNQEKMPHYKPGGFHPICLGDTFKNDRYRVCHKLGWEGFSTVWLAWDRVYTALFALCLALAYK